jgi:PiT family inorganic phosphate transporter
VLWAASVNFIAFLFFGLHIGQTIGTGIIDPDVVSPLVIFAVMMGVIAWNVVTSWALRSFDQLSCPHRHTVGVPASPPPDLAPSSGRALSRPLQRSSLRQQLASWLALVLVLGESWTFVDSTAFGVDRMFHRLQFVFTSLFNFASPREATARMPPRVDRLAAALPQ